MRRTALGLLCLLLGCKQSTDQALKVTVSFEPGLASRGVRVVVSDGMQSRESAPLVVGNSALVIGVVQDSALGDEVTIEAVGYLDAQGTQMTSPAERSQKARATFARGVQPIELTVKAVAVPDGGVDQDQDGFFTPDDCDDFDRAVHPDAIEVCNNGERDDNCNGRSDCEEASCAGQSCGLGGATCSGQQCREQQCGDMADNDGDGLIDCADADCMGQACGVGGLCTSGVCVSGTEVGLCFDGHDNDGDGKVDCLDSDCDGQMCADGNACSENDLCSGGACVPGPLKSCTAPASQCVTSPGACVNDAGASCVFAARTSGGCDDALACTTGDGCQADGGCRGTRVSCAPKGQCFAPGVCQESLDGGCSYAVMAGGCNDGDNCTISDSCDSAGGCAGARVSCGVPGECFNPSTACEADGGCIFTIRTGMGCDGGSCNASGACVAPAVFPYVPSNFAETQLPAMAAAITFSCGTTTYDSSTGSWAGNCAGNPSPSGTAISVGGVSTALLYFDALTINMGATFRVVGGKPVILAVRGAATINGALSASSTKYGVAGAGSNADCSLGSGTNGTVSGNPTRGGGGGGASFATDGGDGENGEGGGPRGVRGTPFGVASLVPLHGGCRGGNGGQNDAANGIGGNGGGALQLSVAGTLTMNSGSTVTASGAGGTGGLHDARTAGGGGGSGGGVLLEGGTVTINSAAAITANGGAGGEGSGYGGSAFNGDDGENGAERGSARATPGDSVACGGAGGYGGAGILAAENGKSPECGATMAGGGGGGSVGRIRINGQSCSINSGATISPPATGTGSNGCP